MTALLRAASRESLAEANSRMDDVVDHSSAADLERLGDELFAVTRLLTAELTLRRHVTDPAVPPQARAGLLRQLLGGRISEQALEVAEGVVQSRWSRPGDVVIALEHLARRATLGVAEKNRSLDDVEDELFRFGRILAREPELAGLLVDESAPAERRVGLLDSVLAGKVSPVTAELLRQSVRQPRTRHLDQVAEELAELAAARRDRYVAKVAAPVRLTREQEERLAETLTRLYGRPMSVQVELDPDLLGGLVVRVGDDVIDGSVVGRLAAARRRLPS